MDWTAQSLALTLLLCVLTLFGFTYTSVGPRKVGTSPIGKRRRNPDSKTFRVQGLPAKYGSDDITRKDVEELVRKAYEVEEGVRISIGSLALHPTRRGESVATLSFSKTPESLDSDALSPFSECQARLDDHFHGLTPLHSCEDSDSDIAIVALSGLNGHAYGSFKKKGGDYMWLRDDLCHSLPNARVYVYGYGTEMENSNSFQTLEDLGLALKTTLRALLKPDDSNHSPSPFVLIGHSLGGLVIKQALCQMSDARTVDEQAILKSLQAVLLFGTPNQGMDIQSLIPMVDGQANEPFIRSLDHDSAELRQQAKIWHSVFVERGNDTTTSVFEIFSFYETVESPTAIKIGGKWKMDGTPTRLVDRNSATHGNPFDVKNHHVQPINRNHSDLVKFTSPTDQVYSEMVLPLLQKHYKIAKNRSPVLLLSEEQRKALDHCRSSLSFQEEQTRVGQILEAENTCTWFTNHPEFTGWLHNDRGLLWLLGPPGAGKSTTMKYAAKFTKKYHSPNAIAVSFFVYGLGIDLQKSLLGLCCSLIRQLLLHVPAAFLPMLSEAREKHEPRHWAPLELQEHLKQGLQEAAKTWPIIIFIDALDELSDSGEERSILLQFLRDLCYGSQHAGLRVKICVSCRYHPNLYNKGVVIPAEKHNRDDIATFVHSSLEDLPKKKKAPLEYHIINSSSGVFQWAYLVCMRVLDLHRAGKPLKAIMSEIESIPKELHSLYNRLLEEITHVDKLQSLKLFRWVCFAIRAVCLRELQHALVMDPDMTELSTTDLAQREDFVEDLEDLENSVKHLSKGLIVFDEVPQDWRDPGWGKRVRLIHVSVMDFMCDGGLRRLQEAECSRSHSSPAGAAHYYLSRVLLRYAFTRRPFDVFEDTTSTTSSHFPLDTYVQTSIKFHVPDAEKHGVDQFDLLYLFGWPNETTAMKSFDAFENTDNWASLVHVLAAWGIMSAFRPLIQYSPGGGEKRDSEISSLLSRGTVPDGVLLPSGKVNLDYTGNRQAITGSRQYMTPLHVAISYDRVAVVHELLRSGRVDLNARTKRQSTPFLIAVASGNLPIVEELLSTASVSLNARDSAGLAALHFAVRAPRADGDVLSRLLRDPRFDPNARDADRRTPLHLAVSSVADLAVVDVLLASPKVDVNARDKKGHTPLIAFVRYAAGLDASEHAELAGVLLRLLDHPRVSCRAKDDMQRTALFYAASEGLESYAGILVERGGGAADVDKLGRTALSQAAAKGYLEIVKVMLDAETLGAERIQFAYQEAKRKKREDVMRRLVQTGRVRDS